jgi:hypothetical protein
VLLGLRTDSDLDASVCEDLGGWLANEASTEQESFFGGASGGKLPELGLDGVDESCHFGCTSQLYALREVFEAVFWQLFSFEKAVSILRLSDIDARDFCVAATTPPAYFFHKPGVSLSPHSRSRLIPSCRSTDTHSTRRARARA